MAPSRPNSDGSNDYLLKLFEIIADLEDDRLKRNLSRIFIVSTFYIPHRGQGYPFGHGIGGLPAKHPPDLATIHHQ